MVPAALPKRSLHPTQNDIQKPEITLNEAMNFIHDRKDQKKIREIESFFTKKLRAQKGMLEQECQYLFYLICAKLKKHNFFETPDMQKIRKQFIKKAAELEDHMRSNYKKSEKTKLDQMQIDAFYKTMEHYFGALEEHYESRHFVDGKEIFQVWKMKFRKRNFQVTGQSWVLYWLYEKTSMYGTSMGRWFFTSVVTIILFAILFAVIDVFQDDKIIDTFSAGHWFDYFYYSIVTFTTLGYGDILPITMLQKIAVSIEVIVGYVMLGLFMTLLGKRVG
jgi:hypothetical protein